MTILKFGAMAARRVVEHSIAQRDNQRGEVTGYDDAGKAITKPVSAPAVVLVHDDGVYLMSNGAKRDLVMRRSPNGKRDIESSFCAYADGCNPIIDGEASWDNSRDAVGGDDFAETLPWAEAIKRKLDGGAKFISVKVSGTQLELL